MKRFHVAIGVADVSRSVEDYTHRLGCPPSVVVPDEYALWRTSTVNLSIRRASGTAGTLRHLGWEDPSALSFVTDTDVNGIKWEHFTAEQQAREIAETWPQTKVVQPPNNLMRDTYKQLGEVGLLAAAFFFAVPPVPSTPEPYDLFPGLAFAGVAFAGSLALALSRKSEAWPFAAAKLILFVAFAWVIHARVAIH